jgi:hypothetical protein
MAIIKDYTITDYIKSYKEESLTFSTLHLKEANDRLNGGKIVLLSDSILDKYTEILNEYLITKTFTDIEFNRYRYNPKLLSYDLYKTPELWFLLLHANQLYSVTEFKINPIKIYTTNIVRIVQNILNLEKTNIDINASEVRTALL